jgi:hypothetical protein
MPFPSRERGVCDQVLVLDKDPHPEIELKNDTYFIIPQSKSLHREITNNF